MKTLFALLTMLALAATACGSSGTGADNATAQAIADSIEADGDGLVENREQAECLGGGLVDGLGEDRVKELELDSADSGGLDGADFQDGEIDTVVDVMDDCIDLVGLMTAEMVGPDISADDADCLGKEIGSEPIKDAMAAALGGADDMPDGFLNSMVDAFAACDVVPS